MLRLFYIHLDKAIFGVTTFLIDLFLSCEVGLLKATKQEYVFEFCPYEQSMKLTVYSPVFYIFL